MNTTATYQLKTSANGNNALAASFSALLQQRAKLRVWAFAAAVRLSDQDKPIALKVLVEVAIVVRMLAQLAQDTRCSNGASAAPVRARRAASRVAAPRVKPAQATRAAQRRQARPVHRPRRQPVRARGAAVCASACKRAGRPALTTRPGKPSRIAALSSSYH